MQRKSHAKLKERDYLLVIRGHFQAYWNVKWDCIFLNSKEYEKDHSLEISEKHSGISKSKMNMDSHRQWNT